MLSALSLLKSMIDDYSKNCVIQKDGTQLYYDKKNNNTIPYFILYHPRNTEDIDALRISNKIPQALCDLYSICNGANFFLFQRKIGKYTIPSYKLSIFGFPCKISRKLGTYEPYDIVVENLSKPSGCPDYWFKFGSIQQDNNANELYIDLLSAHDSVIVMPHSEYKIIEHHDSLDVFLTSFLRQNAE